MNISCRAAFLFPTLVAPCRSLEIGSGRCCAIQLIRSQYSVHFSGLWNNIAALSVLASLHEALRRSSDKELGQIGSSFRQPSFVDIHWTNAEGNSWVKLTWQCSLCKSLRRVSTHQTQVLMPGSKPIRCWARAKEMQFLATSSCCPPGTSRKVEKIEKFEKSDTV